MTDPSEQETDSPGGQEQREAASPLPDAPAADPTGSGAESAGLPNASDRQLHAPSAGAAGEAIGGELTGEPASATDPVIGSVIVDDWGRVPADPRPGATIIAPPEDDPSENPLPARASGR